jgi:hypothetical protein
LHRADGRILEQLRGQPTAPRKCLYCGYDGPMPVLSEHAPWYGHMWVILLLVLTGVGVILALMLYALGLLGVQREVRCPNCSRVETLKR